MGKDNLQETNVKSTVEAVAGLVKSIPVYQDVVQPSARQVGKSLETISKTVNIALAPVKAMVWGYEKIEAFITQRISEKLKSIPEEDIITPPPHVAVPAIEALRYTGHDQYLRELYASLLATSMNATAVHKAHPGYVDIIKNITSDEARMLLGFMLYQVFPLIDILSYEKNSINYVIASPDFSHINKHAFQNRPELTPTYLNNLCRLGLIEIPANQSLSATEKYELLETDEEVKKIKDMIEKNGDRTIGFTRKLARPTAFGWMFIRNVVYEAIPFCD